MSISSESWATERDETPTIGWAYRQLRLTGRGKHVGRFSYYHTRLTSRLSSVQAFLEATRNRLDRAPFDFNVVKLDRHSRISFLLYEDFTVPFPVLLKALSCDVARGTSRLSDYSLRANPPILHRKELLLPGDDPLVLEAVRLTQRLEKLGAFTNAQKIGTRDGWNAALNALGLILNDDKLAAIPCQTR
ncbi:MAG: hypothetical protein OXP11_12005 [Gammaproteobacteria bacterium]|nr:hypothetical protein [Gammaproteobacteria bacterium]